MEKTYIFQPSDLGMKTSEFIIQVHGINTQLDLIGGRTGSGTKSIATINSNTYNSIINIYKRWIEIRRKRDTLIGKGQRRRKKKQLYGNWRP